MGARLGTHTCGRHALTPQSLMSGSPYQSPISPPQPPSGSKPQVITWFHVYCVVLALIYLLCCATSIALLVDAFGAPDPAESQLIGGVLLVISLPLTLLFAGALALPRQPWAWIYGIVLICLGFTSLCTLPFCIALLVYWLKPEVKQYFGRDLPLYASPAE